MATSNKTLVQLVSFATIILLLLLRRVNSRQIVSFVFPEFDSKSDLILQGDASYSSDKKLQLTKVDSNGNPLSNSVGRALYSELVHLYDPSTGRAAAFTSTFLFNILSSSTNPPADGLTFFIASPNTTILPGSDKAFVGLLSDNATINSPDDRFVAVEFDTYPNVNLGDPNYQHIGIDVNSIASVVTKQWELKNGTNILARVIYNPLTKTLSVSVLGGERIITEFTHNIDLTTVLPQWVRVGLSASTGKYTQVNNVLSWSFSSILA